ncbi:hypothetical protein MalM25_34540 [Planctomycetes bacterium MalM25]|nr:hypothetical protein MalM25_34540 [Planctomycetes bacterium MalM25]
MRILIALCAGILPVASANAGLLNEFEPNPAGSDPAGSTFELIGTPLAAFDYWILSIENDPGGSLGVVDRAASVSGSFDANGLAVVTTPDLENPSFTVILTDAFTGSIGDDLDVGDTGTIDTSSLGTVLDAVGVSDTAGDDALLYGASLGGTDILFNGEFEPLSVFREPTTGDWYQTVTVDFGGPSEHIGVFAAGGGPEVDASLFTPDPTATTFGATNPSLVPEPTTVALALLSLAAIAGRKRG